MADKFDQFTERARRVLTLAQEEAQRFNHNHIGTEHLLLGLVREGEGIASGVLASVGVSLDNVRAQVMQVISGAPHGDYMQASRHAGPSASLGTQLPELREILRVIPIAQTQRQDNITMLALALEIYTTGFVITLQLQADGVVDPRFPQGVPDLPLLATDDRGGRYSSEQYGGNGGGTAGRWQWRLARAFTPALDPAARELQLLAGNLYWLRPDERQRRLVPSESLRGPWRFTVALPPPT